MKGDLKLDASTSLSIRGMLRWALMILISETGCFDFALHPGDFAQHPGDVEVGTYDFDL